MPNPIKTYSVNEETTIYIPLCMKNNVSVPNAEKRIKLTINALEKACDENYLDHAFEYVAGIICYEKILELHVATVFTDDAIETMTDVLNNYWKMYGGDEVVVRKKWKYGKYTCSADFTEAFTNKYISEELSDPIPIKIRISHHNIIVAIKYLNGVPGGSYQEWQYKRIKKVYSQFFLLNVELQRFHLLELVGKLTEYDPFKNTAYKDERLVVDTFSRTIGKYKFKELILPVLKKQISTIYESFGGYNSEVYNHGDLDDD